MRAPEAKIATAPLVLTLASKAMAATTRATRVGTATTSTRRMVTTNCSEAFCPAHLRSTTPGRITSNGVMLVSQIAGACRGSATVTLMI